MQQGLAWPVVVLTYEMSPTHGHLIYDICETKVIIRIIYWATPLKRIWGDLDRYNTNAPIIFIFIVVAHRHITSSNSKLNSVIMSSRIVDHLIPEALGQLN